MGIAHVQTTASSSVATRASARARSFKETVSYASCDTWVRSRDVVGSGTCGGGCMLELAARRASFEDPPLRPGDDVTVRLRGIGELRDRVFEGFERIELPRGRARTDA